MGEKVRYEDKPWLAHYAEGIPEYIDYEEKTLSDFLESIIAYTEDIQGFYDNMEMNINADNPTWKNFMHILKGASIYE